MQKKKIKKCIVYGIVYISGYGEKKALKQMAKKGEKKEN